jgi:hypothetical protein
MEPPSRTMTIVIKDQQTGRFYKSPGEWVSSQSEASTFADSFSALQFCDDKQLHDVEVVLHFGKASTNLPLA